MVDPGLHTQTGLTSSAALELGATAFITNDLRLRRVKEITVVLLADHLGCYVRSPPAHMVTGSSPGGHTRVS